jgi:hypothetical protein
MVLVSIDNANNLQLNLATKKYQAGHNVGF